MEKVLVPYVNQNDLEVVSGLIHNTVRWYRKGLISKKSYETIMDCLRKDKQYIKESIANNKGFYVLKQVIQERCT